MKPTDLSIYDFTEDHSTGNCTNPHSNNSNCKVEDDAAITNYDFLQHDRISQQSCEFSGVSVKVESPSLNAAVTFSCSFGESVRNGLITHARPHIPESPCSNGSVDADASDGCDSIQDGSHFTCGSEQEESASPFDGVTHDQSFSGLDMGEMDTSLPADYVFYRDKYFPACLIVFSDTSLKIETAESEASSFEWNVQDIYGIEFEWVSKAITAKVKVCVPTKDVVQEENGQGAAGLELVEFLVCDNHWVHRQEWLMSLSVRYRDIWTIMLNGKVCEGGSLSLQDCEFSDPYIPKFEETFDEVVYPKCGTNTISIRKMDLDLLEPDIFLNDVIIEFYLKYLENNIPASERGRFYFFNSFFFTKLADPDRNTSGVFDGKAGFQRVRKWTRRVKLFEKDYIFIPVNYDLHWSLIVICHPGEVATFNDENVEESVKVPCVLHMDSIRGTHTGLKDIVQSYLLEEWKEKHEDISEDIVTKFQNLRFLSLELPQQENCFDCGLFLLHYAELFINEAPKNFNPFRINKFDNFLNPDWFMPAEPSLKRVRIQRLIYDLANCPLEDGSPSKNESQPAQLLEKNENENGIKVFSGRASPKKSWNSSHIQSIQGMDIGLVDMSLCSNISSLAVRHLECQQFGQGASYGEPGCPTPSIRDEAANVAHLTSSDLGQTNFESIDGVAAGDCHTGYTPGDYNQGFPWNLEFSDQGTNPEDASAHHSSDDSEEVMIMEHEPEAESPGYDEIRTSDEQKGNLDSLTGCYVSASSDMMETLSEDSQEQAKIYGHISHINSHTPNIEEVREMPAPQQVKEIEDEEVITNINGVAEPAEDSQEQAVIYGHKSCINSCTPNTEVREMPAPQQFKEIEDDENFKNINGVAVPAEDSSAESDEGPAAKRRRLTPLSDGERELIRSISEDV